MSLPLPYRYTLRRLLIRNRVLRALVLVFVAWNFLEVHFILNRISAADADVSSHHEPPRKERVFIASSHWNSEVVLRSHWSQAVTDIARKLGPENVFVSVYESGSWDNTKDALGELGADLEYWNVPHEIATSDVTHEDEIAAPPTGDGWVATPQGKQLRRIPFLSRQRNLSWKPLEDLAKKGVMFDKVLFLNDVVFTVGVLVPRNYKININGI